MRRCDWCGDDYPADEMDGDHCTDCAAELFEQDDQPSEPPLDTPSLDTSFHDHEMDV